MSARIVLYDRASMGGSPMPSINGLKVTIAAAMAAFGAAFYRLPVFIQSAAIALSLLTACDTITGVWVAARRRNVTSFAMRQKLAAKAAQFLIVIVLGFAFRLLSDSWVPVGSALGLLIGIEVGSNIENLTRLEQLGGAPLGPLRTWLQKLTIFFPVEIAERATNGAAQEPQKGESS